MDNKKYILLDRDGTINVERKDYVKSFEEFIFLEGAIEGLHHLNEDGFNIIIITNQSPIDRGIISHKDLSLIHSQMCHELLKHGIEICDIFYCPSIPSSNDFDRKPNPGMLIRCSEKYNFNLSETYFIGDKETDETAANTAGCKFMKVDKKNLYQIAKIIIKKGKKGI